MHLQAGEGQHCPPRIAKSPLLSKIFRMNRNFIVYHCLSAYGVLQVCRNPNTQHFWHALQEFRLNQTQKTHNRKKDRGVFKVRTSWITGVPKPLKKLSEPICQPDCRQSGWWRVFLCTSSINYKVCTITNYHYNILYITMPSISWYVKHKVCLHPYDRILSHSIMFPASALIQYKSSSSRKICSTCWPSHSVGS